MTESTHPELIVGCASDVGRKRSCNEDAYHADPTRGLLIVADGMGGERAGEVASSIAVTALPEAIHERVAALQTRPSHAVQRCLQEAVTEISRAVYAMSLQAPSLHEMGTTVVVALALDAKVHITHLGDSRAYLLRKDGIERLTRDHTLAVLLADARQITSAEQETHPANHCLTRYLGMPSERAPDVCTIHLHPGDRLLICTDGLTGMLDDGAMRDILAAQPSAQGAADALVEAANRAGGRDNITVLVADCHART